MDRKSKRNTVIITLFSVAMLAAVAYGVMTHTEPGLLKACSTPPTYVADYTGTCFDVKWQKTPLTVFGAGSRDQRKFLDSVIETMNGRLGFKALVQVDAADADVVVMFDQIPVANVPHEGGVTTHYFTAWGAARKAEIRLFNVTLYQELGPVIEHELGHALGLAHDEFASSVMMIGSGENAWITDYDRKVLRELYAPKK